MMKILFLLLTILAVRSYSLSIFGLNIGDTATRDIDTLIYVDPLKRKVNSRIHYEYGKLENVECRLSVTGKDSVFRVMERYFSSILGKPVKIVQDSSVKYYIWAAQNCSVELIGSEKDSSALIRIDGDAGVRMQMIQQMESLYDSVAAYRKRK
jgi:hypothetical protein